MADQSDTADTDDTATSTSAANTSTAEKTSAKKGAAPKSAPRKRAVSTAKKTSSSAKKASSSGGGSGGRSGGDGRPNAVKIARAAKEQLTELVGKVSETVVGVQRTDDGWEVDLEVVETRRIPDTTDVLAIYRVQLDESGEVEGYQRLERYIRGKSEGGVAGG